MRLRTGILGPVLLLVLVASAAWAKNETSLEKLVKEFRLDNGLTLLVVENDESPTIGLVTSFAVGAAEERPGINGVTHILEHMLFKGTTEVGTSDWAAEKVHHDRIEVLTQQMKAEEKKGRAADQDKIADLLAEREKEMEAAKGYAVDNELWGLYEEAGGQGLNAFTSADITAYILSLPSNRLELWMYLESQRLRRPILRQFYTEIQNVIEERRIGVDSDPQGRLVEAFLAVAFDAHWYGYPIIGYPADITSLTRTETEEWFTRYYAPNQMTLSIVGDVDAKKVHKMVQEYFGDIPSQEPPEPLQTFDLEKEGARRIEVEYDAEPRMMMGWHKKTLPHPDNAALQVLSQVLTGGRSSRLRKRLVETEQIAATINTDHEFPGNRWDNLFWLEATPRAPHTTAEIEAAVWEELERLKREPVGARELEKAKNRIRAAGVRELESNIGLAIGLAYTQAAMGDWRVRLEADAAVEAVTAEDVQTVARATFKKRRTTVANLVAPTFEADPAKEERGRELAAKMTESLGGASKIANMETIRTTSEVKIQTPGGAMSAASETLYGPPHRSKSRFEFFGQSVVTGWSEAGGWTTRGGTVSDIEGDEAREARGDLERDVFFLAWSEHQQDYVLQAEGEKDGHEVLEVHTPSGAVFQAHLDPASGLPKKVTYEATHPMTGQKAQFEETLSDYRAVKGIQRPYKVATTIDGELFAETTVTNVEVNGNVEADEFVRPTG